MGFMNPDLRTTFDIDPAKARQNALVNQGLQQQNQLRGMQIADAPADRNYLLQQREQAEQDKPIMDARAGAVFLSKAIPTIPDVGSYYGQRDALITKFGVPEELLPNQATIQGLAAKNGIDEQQVFERIQQAYNPQAEKTARPGWSAPKEGVDQNGKPIVYRVNDAGEIDVLSGIQPTPKKGMKIYDPATGNLMVDMSGGGEGPELTKKTQGSLEEKFLNASNHLARIQEIKSRYKSEYLQAMPRLKGAWTSLKSKFGGKIPEAEKENLKEQTAFLRTTISNLNKHIKEVTGAQMSEKEAGRISLEEPKAGQSWFDFLWSGDSPIEFESKIEDIEITLQAAMARTQWYLSKGLTYPEIEKIVNTDAARDLDQIKERFKNYGR